MRSIRYQRSHKLLNSLLLLMLLWSQFCSATPQVHDHSDQEPAASYVEMQDHLLVLQDSQHEGEDGSEHELHLHACGCHVAAMPLSFNVHLVTVAAPRLEQFHPHSPIRSQEKLLRPPIV